MSPPDSARILTDIYEPGMPHHGESRILPFPPAQGRQPAMAGVYPDAGANFWDTIEADGRRRATRRSGYLISAVILHLLIASLFLITLSREETPPVDEVQIEMLSPPAPPPLEPPKAVEVKEVVKPKQLIQPRPIPKLVLQIDKPPPTPVQTIAPPVPVEPPPPAPAAASTAPPDYVARLFAHLEANKRYPRDLQTAHVQGTTLLHFRMDHQGRVLSFDIQKSSGNARLDAEVTAMIQRAQPLPIPPAEMADPQDITIPIRFTVH